jgi:3-oxoadipate enol-lactonase
MHSVTVPGAVVRFDDAGRGAPVVLLHGLGGDAGFWTREREQLADRFRVITIDLRGSGRTVTDAPDHEIADLADDVVAVLDRLGIARAHVVGFSMGGYVAQSLAVRHPSRVDRLVLAATSATLNAQLRLFMDAVLAAWEAGVGPDGMFALVAPWLFSPAFVAEPANAAWFALPPDDPEEQSLAAWRGQYLAQRRFDGTGELTRIACPTLVLTGRQDVLVPEDEARAFADRIRGARCVLVPDAGHLVNVEKPERFIAAVDRFLTSGTA